MNCRQNWRILKNSEALKCCLLKGLQFFIGRCPERDSKLTMPDPLSDMRNRMFAELCRVFYTLDKINYVSTGGDDMFGPKFRFTHDEVRIIVLALVELKNQLIAEGRYTDAVDELLVRFVD